MADRIAILGGKGMLGSDLSLQLRKLVIDHEVFDLPDFDITNTEQIRKVLREFKAVINCAAYTIVDNAEIEPDLAYRINADAVGNLGNIGRELGVWVMHISTDFVFDGKLDRPYLETDPPNPINTYGKSKLAGEKLFIESKCPGCIIRVEWTYGTKGVNFVKKLVERAKTGVTIKVVDDQVGSPTATTEAAKAICALLRKKPEGLYHFASAGSVSRYEMARFIFDMLNMPVDLARCKTKDFPSKAARPLNSRFCCDKIRNLLDEPMQDWQKPLEVFLKQL